MDWCRLDVLEELGLNAAPELWLEPGHYVAIEPDERSVAT